MESTFQFTNPTLREVVFKLNPRFVSEENREIQIQMNMAVGVNKTDGKNEALVELTCELGEESDSFPFMIRITEQASFRWEESVSDKDAKQMLNLNAPAMLLSYIRPMVAQITAATPYGAYNIPFFNFIEENREGE